MGQALYRKYRSKGFDEVVGQDHIVKTLQNALKSGRISHAYLFTGPRGTGKTSVARIFAREVNGLEYQDESIHLDIIEIDAASNRRIDEIRELRERVHIAPTSAKYKVYIIDEVHMLTREAFNALLKTLEEPPAHCIFILATTEAHKLPETIISRTQRFNFQPLEVTTAADQLQMIAKKEKIDINRDSIELLATHGSGSLRDSIGLLDQLAASGAKVDEAKVREVLGLPTSSMINDLMESIDRRDSSSANNVLSAMKEQGINPVLMAKELAQQLRQKLLDGSLDSSQIKLLRRLSMVAAAADPQERLEVDILEAAYTPASSVTKTANTAAPQPTSKPKDSQPEPQPVQPSAASGIDQEDPSGDFDLTMWPTILNKVKTQAASLYTALRLAEPRLEDGKLILAFQFPLHQKKLALAKNLDLVSKIIKDVSGVNVAVGCVVDKGLGLTGPKRPPTVASSSDNSSLETISNIFGAAEMLES